MKDEEGEITRQKMRGRNALWLFFIRLFGFGSVFLFLHGLEEGTCLLTNPIESFIDVIRATSRTILGITF